MSAPNYPLGAPVPPPTPQSYSYQPPAPPKKRKTWLWVLLIIVSLIIVCMVGCCVLLFSYGKSHLALTPQGAMINLHQHMTKSEDAAIYAESDPNYKQSKTEVESDTQFELIHNNLGNPTKTNIVETTSSGLSGQDVVKLTVLTTFDKGSANEIVYFRKGSDNMYHMLSYEAQSDNLR